MTTATSLRRHRPTTWPPARLFLAVSGAFLLLTGVAGVALDSSFPTSSGHVAHGHAYVFGIFETNGWHSLGALGMALPALGVALARPALSQVMALALGGSNALVFLLFAIWEPSAFWIASNTADQALHAALAAGGIASAGCRLSRCRCTGWMGGRRTRQG